MPPLAGPPAARHPCVVAYAPRERARALVRAAFPRRAARVVFVRSAEELTAAFRAELVDGVVADAGGGTDERWRVMEEARAYPSAPLFALIPLHGADGPMLAHCAALGPADVLVDGVDDAALREIVAPLLFCARFAAGLGEPPPALGLSGELQRQTWGRAVRDVGRPIRGGALATTLGVTREHLSRSFGGATPPLKRVLELVRLLAAATLARNPGYRVRDVATVLEYASASHLARTATRALGVPAAALAERSVDELVAAFVDRGGAG